ncbi:MAG: alanine dehydrogenase, partial [Deltaproteobacteria bacterium]|nr:alanine dehydrogenase [Deltaproteobacteria bacterium]
MIIGILKEIKSAENRVSMIPAGVETLVQNSHAVLVEKDAGKGTDFTDNDYVKAGGEIVASPGEIYKRADMVMHVKEPLSSEYDLIRKDQIIFTFLHLAANEKLTRALIKSRSVCIAYETIQ